MYLKNCIKYISLRTAIKTNPKEIRIQEILYLVSFVRRKATPTAIS